MCRISATARGMERTCSGIGRDHKKGAGLPCMCSGAHKQKAGLVCYHVSRLRGSIAGGWWGDDDAAVATGRTGRACRVVHWSVDGAMWPWGLVWSVLAVGVLTYVLLVLFWGRSSREGTSIDDFIAAGPRDGAASVGTPRCTIYSPPSPTTCVFR